LHGPGGVGGFFFGGGFGVRAVLTGGDGEWDKERGRNENMGVERGCKGGVGGVGGCGENKNNLRSRTI